MTTTTIAATSHRGARQPGAIKTPTETRAIIAVAFGLLWIGGLGSIVALMLASSVRRNRTAHGLPRSTAATVATVLGLLGLAACVWAAVLTMQLSPAPI